MRFFLLLLSPLWCYAQNDTLAFMGDSHCNGGFGLGDSNWISRMTKTYEENSPGAVAYKYCSGGETIRTNMPRWYPGSVSGKSIDDALTAGCTTFFFLQSGNHVAFSVPQDTSKWCYLKLADTLTRLGKRWAFSTIGPRQTTYAGGMDFAKYNAQRDSLNSWLRATFPGHIFSLDTLLDRVTNKPKAAILRIDSLHYLAPGHRYMWQTNIRDVVWIDSALGYTKIKGYNMSITTSAVNFGFVDLKYVYVYGSNDGVLFNMITYREFLTSPTIPVSGYTYVKVVAQNATKTITVTKRFI